VQQVPHMDAKFYAATQVVDEARHVAFGRLALRDFYPQLTEKERDERVAEEFDRHHGIRPASLQP
jgi:hypothetical protein